MKLSKFGVVLVSVVLGSVSLGLQAEGKVKAEDLVEAPVGPADDLSNLQNQRRAKLTEEQAVNQMKYMMVKGWQRIDKDLVSKGKFDPVGLMLNSRGDFKPIVVGARDGEEAHSPKLQYLIINRQLEEQAKTRTVWSVGMMYIQEYDTEVEGSETPLRINVLVEHIAGWARSWSYPFKVVDGEVKLGQPVEKELPLHYFVKN